MQALQPSCGASSHSHAIHPISAAFRRTCCVIRAFSTHHGHAECCGEGLARDAGLKVAEYTSVESLASSHQVKMKVDERVGRRVNVSCEVAGGKARWMEALPVGLARI